MTITTLTSYLSHFPFHIALYMKEKGFSISSGPYVHVWGTCMVQHLAKIKDKQCKKSAKQCEKGRKYTV